MKFLDITEVKELFTHQLMRVAYLSTIYFWWTSISFKFYYTCAGTGQKRTTASRGFYPRLDHICPECMTLILAVANLLATRLLAAVKLIVCNFV